MLVSQLWFEFQVEIYLGLVTFAWLNYLLSDLSCAHHLKKKQIGRKVHYSLVKTGFNA